MSFPVRYRELQTDSDVTEKMFNVSMKCISDAAIHGIVWTEQRRNVDKRTVHNRMDIAEILSFAEFIIQDIFEVCYTFSFARLIN